MDSDWSFVTKNCFTNPKKDLPTEDVVHSPLHRLVVSKFYGVARTNKASRRALADVLHRLDAEKIEDLILVQRKYKHKSLINLDLYDAPNVDIISNGGTAVSCKHT